MENYVVMVVGVGGTGGHLVSVFTKFLSNYKIKEKIKLVLIDGDVVEAKNCERQQFLQEDVGKNKALSLQEAVIDTYEIETSVYTDYITELSQLNNIYDTITENINRSTPIVIGCVDNHAARKVMNEYFNTSKDIVYLDSANEYSVGEVVFGVKQNGKVLSPSRVHYYPDILTDDTPNREEISCEELNKVEPQHLVTNIMAANILVTSLVDLITNKTIPKGIVYFDSLCYMMRHREFE